MRPVHDVFIDNRPFKAPKPCAFVQHGNQDSGFEYQTVCIWCEKDIGERIVFSEDDPYTDRRLYERMLALTLVHLPFCTADQRQARVFKATEPLHTDEVKKVL